MNIKILYEDNDLLVVDKPAGVVVFHEGMPAQAGKTTENTLIDYLIEKYPDLKMAGETPRYGIVHRLDKDTSGILLVAKTNKSLVFFQKQFSTDTYPFTKVSTDKKVLVKDEKNSQILEKTIEKRYIALVVGNVKNDEGIIHTLIGRAPSDKRKQKSYLLNEPMSGVKREAITKYKVLQRFTQLNNFAKSKIAAKRHLTGVENYTLLEIKTKTGRRHQIRCHLSYIHHPIAGDKMYGFKNSPVPKGLTRQFLHASYLKIKLPSDEIREFNSELPEELKQVLEIL